MWAVAATAVGLIALLDTSGDEAEQTAGRAAGRVEALERGQRRLLRRLATLGGRVDRLPRLEDLDMLDGRLAAAEDDASKAAAATGGVARRLEALERRVRQLERGPPGGGAR